jgi:hypothetical protein
MLTLIVVLIVGIFPQTYQTFRFTSRFVRKQGIYAHECGKRPIIRNSISSLNVEAQGAQGAEEDSTSLTLAGKTAWGAISSFLGDGDDMAFFFLQNDLKLPTVRLFLATFLSLKSQSLSYLIISCLYRKPWKI